MHTLTTPRLHLRPHILSDFPSSAALWADPVVTQYIGGRPFSREESWARFLRYAGHWLVLGFGYWVIEERETGRFLGEIGFADYRRDIEPAIDGIPELGWALTPSAHGHGYATEAAQAALAWAQTNLEARRTACLIHPGNAPSLRVAQKCGFQEHARTTYKAQPTILFERSL